MNRSKQRYSVWSRRLSPEFLLAPQIMPSLTPLSLVNGSFPSEQQHSLFLDFWPPPPPPPHSSTAQFSLLVVAIVLSATAYHPRPCGLALALTTPPKPLNLVITIHRKIQGIFSFRFPSQTTLGNHCRSADPRDILQLFSLSHEFTLWEWQFSILGLPTVQDAVDLGKALCSFSETFSCLLWHYLLWAFLLLPPLCLLLPSLPWGFLCLCLPHKCDSSKSCSALVCFTTCPTQMLMTLCLLTSQELSPEAPKTYFGLLTGHDSPITSKATQTQHTQN